MKNKKLIYGLIILALINIPLIIGLTKNNGKRLACTSKEGFIIIKYDDNELIDFYTDKIYFEFNKQHEYAKKVGVETYLDSFTTWFEDNTSGTCKRR